MTEQTPPLSEAEYLELCREFGINEAGTFPTDEKVRARYPPDHLWDNGDGTFTRHGDLFPADPVADDE